MRGAAVLVLATIALLAMPARRTSPVVSEEVRFVYVEFVATRVERGLAYVEVELLARGR